MQCDKKTVIKHKTIHKKMQNVILSIVRGKNATQCRYQAGKEREC
jgi:hypothetical protein